MVKTLHVWHTDFQRKIKAQLRRFIGSEILRCIRTIGCSSEAARWLPFNQKPSTLCFAWFEGQST